MDLYDTLTKAMHIVEKHKKTPGLHLYQARIEQLPFPPVATAFGNFTAHITMPAELRLETMITIDHGSWYETLDVDYLIHESDLGDNSEVNKVIGKIDKFDDNTKRALRLAYIIWDGYRYATEHIQDKDFRPRVINIQMRFDR